jgi:hypothetical protein
MSQQSRSKVRGKSRGKIVVILTVKVAVKHEVMVVVVFMVVTMLAAMVVIKFCGKIEYHLPRIIPQLFLRINFVAKLGQTNQYLVVCFRCSDTSQASHDVFMLIHCIIRELASNKSQPNGK